MRQQLALVSTGTSIPLESPRGQTRQKVMVNQRSAWAFYNEHNKHRDQS